MIIFFEENELNHHPLNFNGFLSDHRRSGVQQKESYRWVGVAISQILLNVFWTGYELACVKKILETFEVEAIKIMLLSGTISFPFV